MIWDPLCGHQRCCLARQAIDCFAQSSVPAPQITVAFGWNAPAGKCDPVRMAICRSILAMAQRACGLQLPCNNIFHILRVDTTLYCVLCWRFLCWNSLEMWHLYALGAWWIRKVDPGFIGLALYLTTSRCQCLHWPLPSQTIGMYEMGCAE